MLREIEMKYNLLKMIKCNIKEVQENQNFLAKIYSRYLFIKPENLSFSSNLV